MANALYNLYKQHALDIGHADAVDMNTDTIKVALVKAGYTFSAAHAFVTDLGANIIARSPALTSPTVVNGTFDAADVTVPTVAAGNTVAKLVVYNDTGSDATSPLIAYIDLDQSSVAISLPTNGSDILVSFDAAGIFDL